MDGKGRRKLKEMKSHSRIEILTKPADFTSLSAEAAARLIRAGGTDKVLYGTDYPMWPLDDDLAAFFAVGLTEEENRAILSENAKRVFRIE